VATITVKNGTAAVLDLTLADAILYGGPNGVQAEDEYSFWGFEGSIPPGGTATAKFSWSLPAEYLDELRLEFAPTWAPGHAWVSTRMEERSTAGAHRRAVTP
jgi:hypothetical protein